MHCLHLTGNSLETVSQLFEEVLNHALVVVAPAEDVIQRREAMRLAALLLMIELLCIKLVAAGYAPVIARRVHRKARRQSPIDADDQ